MTRLCDGLKHLWCWLRYGHYWRRTEIVEANSEERVPGWMCVRCGMIDVD